MSGEQAWPIASRGRHGAYSNGTGRAAHARDKADDRRSVSAELYCSCGYSDSACSKDIRSVGLALVSIQQLCSWWKHWQGWCDSKCQCQPPWRSVLQYSFCPWCICSHRIFYKLAIRIWITNYTKGIFLFTYGLFSLAKLFCLALLKCPCKSHCVCVCVCGTSEFQRHGKLY